MDSGRTVLVLGAGASQPYGFPLGADLKGRVHNQAFQWLNGRLNHDFDKTRLPEFVEMIGNNETNRTIDEFLDQQPRFREIGAYLIAGVIESLEVEPRPWPRDWYHVLYQELKLNEEPDASDLSIVTFNYDRSLERFFEKHVPANCPERLHDFARGKFKKTRIVHAHGSLGEYPSVKYGRSDLASAAKSLLIPTDTRLADSPAFVEAKQLVAQAKRIMFLGFGYNETTLHALFPDRDFDGKQIVGTFYEANQPKLKSVLEFFKGKLFVAPEGDKAEPFVSRMTILSKPWTLESR
jgi:hypothetical protein